MERILRQAVLVLGICVLVFGGVLTAAPSLVEPVIDVSTVDETFDGILGGILLAGTILLGVGVGLVKGYTVSNADLPEPLVTTASEHTTEETLIGREFSRAYESAHEEADVTARENVRETLREAATETVGAIDQLSPEEASEQVRSGEWTADPVVAAFVGDENAPDPPMQWKVYAWLYEDRAFAQSVERSLTELRSYERSEYQ